MCASKASKRGLGKRGPSTATSKTSYASDTISSRSDNKAKSHWTHRDPLNEACQCNEAHVDEKGDVSTKPTIVELCEEDKKRIMNLVEELAKHVEEKRALAAELVRTKRDAGEREGEAKRAIAELQVAKREAEKCERAIALHSKERRELLEELDVTKRDAEKHKADKERLLALHADELDAVKRETAAHEAETERAIALHVRERRELVDELEATKRDNELLSRELEAVAHQARRLKERAASKSAHVSELERDKRSLRSRLVEARRKLSQAVRLADRCKADLRKAVALLRRQGGGGRADAATQTGEGASGRNVAGVESVVLGELFFTAPGIPREMEPIFFLPAPYNVGPEEGDLWR